MRLFARSLNFFFHHLYHGLAFAYDAVAASVSFGQWIGWTKATLPYLQGTRILELGHGPGHLHRFILDLGLFAVGLDASPQMGRLARRRLFRAGYASPCLTRGLGQCLPFCDGTFDTVLATFPADYIFAAQTASEVRRVLRNGGRLIILPVAWPKNRVLTWLYRTTNQQPSEAVTVVKSKIGQPFIRAGFDVVVETLEVKSGVLLIVLALKPAES